MSRIAKLAAVGAASAAAVAMTAAPAAAWTNGSYTANLSGNMTIKSADGNTTLANCTGSTLTGTMNTAGSFNVATANATGCGVGVTPKNLSSWSGSISGTSASLNGFQMAAAGCTYGGNLSGTSTGTNAIFVNQTVTAISGFCLIGSVKVSATYNFTQP